MLKAELLIQLTECPCKLIHIEDIQLKLRELKFPKEIQIHFRDTRLQRWVIADLKDELLKFKHVL